MPDFDLLSNSFDGRLKFVKLNTEESPEITSTYGVQTLPTLKFFCGGKTVAEIIGYMPRTALKAQLETMLANHPDCLARSNIVISFLSPMMRC
jgi:thioredoxin 1